MYDCSKIAIKRHKRKRKSSWLPCQRSYIYFNKSINQSHNTPTSYGCLGNTSYRSNLDIFMWFLAKMVLLNWTCTSTPMRYGGRQTKFFVDLDSKKIERKLTPYSTWGVAVYKVKFLCKSGYLMQFPSKNFKIYWTLPQDSPHQG